MAVLIVAFVFVGIYLFGELLAFLWSIIKNVVSGNARCIKDDIASFVEKKGQFNKFSIVCIIFVLVAPAYSIYNYMTFIPDGLYCYYISVDTDSGEHVFPAAVIFNTREREETSEDYYSQEHTAIFKNHEIGLYRFYFSDVDYCEFDPDFDVINLKTYKAVSAKDGSEYKIRLLNEKTIHPAITEIHYEENRPWDLLLTVTSAVYAAFVLLIQLKNTICKRSS